jgi:putative DNA primase/helicase
MKTNPTNEVPLDPVMAKHRQQQESRRIYLFTATGLRKATKGYDFQQVLKALDAAGAFVRKGENEIAIPTRTPRGVERLYYIDPTKLT